MKKKIFSVLFALVLVLTLSLVPAAVSASPGPILGFWQPGDPDGGTLEYSTTEAHSPTYSVYLEALVDYAPDDNNEIYVGEPTGVTTLNSLTNVSFWYYAVSGGDPVPPEIDVWLDTDGTYDAGPPPTGDDQWLLGQFPEVTTWDTWVEVPLNDIEWIKATGGSTVYGTGSAGLTAAKAETDSGTYATLGDCPLLAIGIQVGGPATRHTTRAGDQKFYVDDLTINATTYDLGPTSVVGLTAEIPSIVAISVTPTSIDFGTLYPGQSSAVTALTVENIGTVTVDVDASVDPTPTVFDNLELDTDQVPTTGLITNLAGGAVAAPVDAQLVVPSDYSATGVETATLIFEATASP